MSQHINIDKSKNLTLYKFIGLFNGNNSRLLQYSHRLNQLQRILHGQCFARISALPHRNSQLRPINSITSTISDFRRHSRRLARRCGKDGQRHNLFAGKVLLRGRHCGLQSQREGEDPVGEQDELRGKRGQQPGKWAGDAQVPRGRNSLKRVMAEW
jgi:hypothetical protein